jgi:Lipocalin-like domain
MKTMLLKNGIFTLMMSALMLVSLPSCDREEETPELTFEESLVGTWDITSYNLDGDEWMDFIVEVASITFEEPANHSGIFMQEVTFADGETASLSGRYIVDETNHQVVMYYEGEPITADIVITGNKMHWESIQDEYPLVLKATKRQ